MKHNLSHEEKHFASTELVRDIVIGMSDGLTVPFALAAGLTGVVASTSIVVTAGFAEIAAGSIAMGLGGYLAARTDNEHYESEKQREIRETIEIPEAEEEEVARVFREYGLSEQHIAPVVQAICSDRDKWVDFMMKYELGLDEPDPARAFRSAATIAVSYIAGGMIPLSPYIFMNNIFTALIVSVIVTLIALFLFGYIKGKFTGLKPFRSGYQTILIGGLAAAAAFLIAGFI